MSIDDTQSTPEVEPDREWEPPRRGLMIAVGTLAAALVVALGALTILLLT